MGSYTIVIYLPWFNQIINGLYKFYLLEDIIYLQINDFGLLW